MAHQTDRETGDQYNELTKYPRHRGSDEEIEDQYLKLKLEKAIAKKLKLMAQN